MTEKYYHLVMPSDGGPVTACGAVVKGASVSASRYAVLDTWDWYGLWSKKKTSTLGVPRCPSCLESDYYALSLLGDLP